MERVPRDMSFLLDKLSLLLAYVDGASIGGRCRWAAAHVQLAE